MKVRIKSANSVKCPKCGKLISSQWFGYRCSQCTYEQLNARGQAVLKENEWEESES